MRPEAVRARLEAMADEARQQFNTRLIPGIEPILGARMPDMRKLAREIARDDWQAYWATASDASYEETLLQGLVLGYARADFDTLRPMVASFVEKIDNWATCDLFCGSLKVAETEPDAVWAFLAPYFDRQEPYPLRFAIVMALDHYLDEAHIDEVLEKLDAIAHEHYYVRMGVAWAVSMAYVAHPARVLPFLQDNHMDDWTHNKALQKIIESRQVDDAAREMMRSLKRKKGKAQCAEKTGK